MDEWNGWNSSLLLIVIVIAVVIVGRGLFG